MSAEGLSSPEIDAIADRLRDAHERGGWRAAALVAEAIRDAREKTIVDRVEHHLEALIVRSGQENPSLTVRDVRARLFEVPQ